LPEAERLRGNSFALRHAALSRCGDWHAPIPQLIRESSCISGYPVFDRQPEPLLQQRCVEPLVQQCATQQHSLYSTHTAHFEHSKNKPAIKV
jgi:hypothetical protein